MPKFDASIEQLLELDHRGWSVYGLKTSPGKIILKRESFKEGEVPDHLKSYIGQTAAVAKACKGKKGLAWVQCLRDKARELGITKKKE